MTIQVSTKSNQAKKLTLRKETLRQLTPSELRQVAGGTTNSGGKGQSQTQ